MGMHNPKAEVPLADDLWYKNPTLSKARKNKRDWCRGKVGVRHVPVVVVDPYFASLQRANKESGVCYEVEPNSVFSRRGRRNNCFHITMCESCGRRLDFDSPDVCPTLGTRNRL